MWITRLDKSDTASTGVKVYHVRYGDARQIAVLLNDIFGGGRQGGSAVDSATNQIAPGAGVATSIERSAASRRAAAHRPARARSRAARRPTRG